MGLYDYDFCHNLLYGGWDSGIINNLKDARDEIKQNFKDMDLENASVGEDMGAIVDEMVAELDRLISEIESVHFR
ncbi:hypothetical protein F3157_14985 [Virgibacillus dakarensis]|uniref:Uncharacterized protein n=1 Tax=Lentibacillus populi TaxID=1827502 RepID=A0A9W5U0V4_9BACI|nr:hypothetical protein [Lentibacillus populi]MBT2216283.1 hypothetical protein [Virgibacillus dakarensis]MTW86953.1 hypothetical protein [Virgibacillus dakarensis]GGB57514.1 hypothetical protein GCM10011409_38740 [Lentibacillus populi]